MCHRPCGRCFPHSVYNELMPLSLFFLSLFVFLFNLTAGSMIQNPFTFSEEFAKLRNPEKNNSEFEGVALSLIPEFDFAHVFSIYYTVRRLPEDWATVIFTSNTNLEAKTTISSSSHAIRRSITSQEHPCSCFASNAI